MNRLLLIAAFAALAPAAFAQDSAAPAATAPVVPPPNCTQPTIQTDDKGAVKNVKELNAQVQVYKTCMNAYIDDQKKQARAADAQLQAHQEASNAAVNAFNDFAKRLNAAAATAQPKSAQ